MPAHLVRSGGVRAGSALRDGVDRLLPVHGELRSLLPEGGLRRGATVSVAAATGGMSLLFALLGAASSGGEWCAMAGVPEVGVLSAAEYGVVPERFALVPYPGPEWWTVVAALLDGFGLVVARPAGPVSPVLARRLAARTRQRGAVLLVHGDWPGADVAMRCSDPVWEGLDAGRGRLRRRALTIEATGRGAAARPRSTRVLLPSGRTGPGSVAPLPAAAPEVTVPEGFGAADEAVG
ncbi:hypothetical protein [Actinocatenispora rupis]|uniref:hypothetical protein n=1 Tax=Actinocatenispora rupis TaxID=519421 RepID=UPI0019453C9A|nr:hypothetical protein [Actinocatenispora rupis]